MKQKDQKKRILILQQALLEKSSEEHPLTMQQLLQCCEEAGISAERKAIYDDLRVLQEFGMDIIYTRTPKQGYFVASRLMETAELKLLIDAVQASSFISCAKSEKIIRKLSSMTNCYEAQKLTSSISYPKNKAMNESIFYLIDQIQEAIDQSCAVSFQYFDLTIKKERKYRYESRRYDLIPYALFWDNQRYYCIGYDVRHQSFSHYRVDKMDRLKLMDVIHERQPFDLNEYTSRIFNMYQGVQEDIVLKVDISLANTIFDQFGQDVLIESVQENSFIVHLSMNIAPPLISWLLQFNQRLQVLSPALLIDEIRKTAIDALALYKKEDSSSSL